MRIYFIRHGENQANIEHIFSYKIIDYSLTPRGKIQAEGVAEWLADKRIARIYSSPLKRARETSEIIARRVLIPKVTILEELRELNVGVLDGKADKATWDLHDSIVNRWGAGEPEVSFEGGEDHFTLRNRLKQAIEQIVAENPSVTGDRGIAVVCHGGLLTYGLPWLCDNLTMDHFKQGLRYTAIAVVETSDHSLTCTGWDLGDHLYR